jgi:cellulose synthase/poly-beta-1,6-N-acetylglucosamine synthase-like glycosyltransferase
MDFDPNIFEDFVVLILAKDEADIIGDSIRHLIEQDIPTRTIQVVADQCTDTTAQVAASCGVKVLTRNGSGRTGKGPALAWWVRKTRTHYSHNSKILILDADSRLTASALDFLVTGELQDDCVYQFFVQPVVEKKTTINLLAALSEVSEQRIHDDLARKIGFSTRLRGTGMVIPRWVLEKYCPRLQTHVEDIELSLLLTAEKIRIESVPNAVILDPKPTQTIGAIHQRARWLGGQIDVIRRHNRELLRLLAMGPAAWGVIKATLFKPKALLLPIQALVVGLLWFLMLGFNTNIILLSVLLVLNTALVIDIASLLYGIRFVQDRRETLVALLAAPLYIVLWMHSLSLILASRKGWLRSRSPARPSAVRYASGTD